MSKYSGAEDIYRELVEQSSESWLLGLVAFAVVEEQRVEWMRHHESNHGILPSQAEIKTWYEQQPASILLRAKGTAENALKTYSEEVQAIVDEQQRREIEEGIIVGEIRAMNRFWPQFGVNLAGGIASSILFAALLTLLAFLVLNDHSPVEIGSKIKPRVEDTQNGKETGSNKQTRSISGLEGSSKQ